MQYRLSVLIGAGAILLGAAVVPAAADDGIAWVEASIASSKAAPASTSEVTTARRSRSRVAISGLARLPEEITPKRSPSADPCIPAQLQRVLSAVEANFGAVRINSTCRSASANRAAGGAPQSLHLSGQAVDFRVFGNVGSVMAFLRANSDVGGLKHYGGGLFHIDTGERRTF